MNCLPQAIEMTDRKLLLLINGANNPWLDQFMWTISQTTTWIPFYLLCVWLLWLCYKKECLRPLVFITFAIILANSISSDIIKPLVQRPRPTHTPELLDALHLHLKSNGHFYYGGQYGFLSSHAANTSVIAILMFYMTIPYHSKQLFLGIFLTFYTLIVCYSRVYLCAHYPSDIMGGLLLGIAIAILTLFIFTKYQNWCSNNSYLCRTEKKTKKTRI